MRNIIIIIAIVVVGFLAWKFIPMGGSNPSTSSGQATEQTGDTSNTTVGAQVDVTLPTTSATQTTVTYDGATFSPALVNIKQGDSVTFVNNSTGGMSVASDPHPTHTDYPEFDQYKTDARGQKTFTFVFAKVGSWGYHNHLNHAVTGRVIVTAK